MNLHPKTKQAVVFALILGISSIVASQLSSCGTVGDQGPQGPQGATVVISPSPAPDAVQTVVNGYNEYLVSQGSDPIQPGLRCTLYNVPNMPANPCLLASSVPGCTVVSSSSGYAQVATWTYTGTVDQPNQAGSSGFNMLPKALQGLYTTNFAVTCTGYFIGSDYNYHAFSVASDDGALVYIGGTLVLNDDGLHGVQTVKGEKYLEAQVYSFQLNYFQGPGSVALILNEDGSLLPAANLYH